MFICKRTGALIRDYFPRDVFHLTMPSLGRGKGFVDRKHKSLASQLAGDGQDTLGTAPHFLAAIGVA